MTIRHLKIFVAVAECGKMRLAAEKLFISQPSVSQAIKEIESYYGLQLFDRLSQKIYLTNSGERLLSYARHIVASFDEMEVEMRHAGKNTFLRIGSSVSVGTCLLSGWIKKMEENVPSIETKVMVTNTMVIEEMILKSELDIAVVEGEVLSEDIIKMPVYEDDLVLVAGATHPFYTMPEIPIELLQDQELVSREDGSLERNQFEQLLKEKNIKTRAKWSCTNTEAIKNAVIHGHGLAIISSMLIKEEVKENKLAVIPIKGVSLRREINLIYHKHKFLSESMKQFIDTCTVMYQC